MGTARPRQRCTAGGMPPPPALWYNEGMLGPRLSVVKMLRIDKGGGVLGKEGAEIRGHWQCRGGVRRDALEGKGPQRRPQQRLGRRLEEVAEAVGGGYCRLQMPLRRALGVGGTVAGHRLSARGGGGSPPSNASLCVRQWKV